MIKKYPDTELAKQIARASMARSRASRISPTKPLGILVDLFPESRERTRVARIPELQNGGTRLAEVPDNSGTTVGNAEPVANDRQVNFALACRRVLTQTNASEIE